MLMKQSHDIQANLSPRLFIFLSYVYSLLSLGFLPPTPWQVQIIDFPQGTNLSENLSPRQKRGDYDQL